MSSWRRATPSCRPVRTTRRSTGWRGVVPDLGVPLLFDLAAYRVTSSKAASNDLMRELGVPAPLPWPACGLPAVVKPSAASGSEGVRVAASERELEEARRDLERAGHEVVVEEFVAGPSLSIEVLALDGTRGAVSRHRVSSSTTTSTASASPLRWPGDAFYADVVEEALASLADSGGRLAEALRLSGIMDVEVMIAGGEAKVIEIDARLPSQTPAAVLHAYDVNLLELLVAAFATGRRTGAEPACCCAGSSTSTCAPATARCRWSGSTSWVRRRLCGSSRGSSAPTRR